MVVNISRKEENRELITQVFKQKVLLKYILSFIPYTVGRKLINIAHLKQPHKNITRYPTFTDHCIYYEISSVDWIITNQYYNLLHDKIKRNQYLQFNQQSRKSFLNDKHLITNIDYFSTIYNRFIQWFIRSSDILDIVLPNASIDVISFLLTRKNSISSNSDSNQQYDHEPTLKSLGIVLERGDIEILKVLIKNRTFKFWKQLLQSLRMHDQTTLLTAIYKQCDNIELVRFFFGNLWQLTVQQPNNSNNNKSKSLENINMFNDILELKKLPFLQVMIEEFKLQFDSVTFKRYFIHHLLLKSCDWSLYQMSDYLFKKYLNEYEYTRCNSNSFHSINENSTSREIYESLVKMANIVYPDAIIPEYKNNNNISNCKINNDIISTVTKATTTATAATTTSVVEPIKYGNFWKYDFNPNMNEVELLEFMDKNYKVSDRIIIYPECDRQLPLIKKKAVQYSSENFTFYICACANGCLEIVKYLIQEEGFLNHLDIDQGLSIAFYFRRYEIIGYLLNRYNNIKKNNNNNNNSNNINNNNVQTVVEQEIYNSIKSLEAIGSSGDIEGFKCLNRLKINDYNMSELLFHAAMRGRYRFLSYYFDSCVELQNGKFEKHLFALVLDIATNYQQWNVFEMCINKLTNYGAINSTDITSVSWNSNNTDEFILHWLERASNVAIEKSNIEFLRKLKERFNLQIHSIESHSLVQSMQSNGMTMLYYISEIELQTIL